MILRTAPAGVALVLVLAATACGERVGTQTKLTSAGSAATTTIVRRGALRGTPSAGAGEAADFALRDQSGHVIRLSAQHGKFVLLTFLYTNCPDVCPLIAANLNQVLRNLPGPQRREVSVIAVSADPVHDTRRTVRQYVASHRLAPDFHYLIGSESELRPIWQSYNVLVEPNGDERVAHSTYVLLIDRAGRPRLYYSPQVQARDLLHDLRRLMRRS